LFVSFVSGFIILPLNIILASILPAFIGILLMLFGLVFIFLSISGVVAKDSHYLWIYDYFLWSPVGATNVRMASWIYNGLDGR